MNILEVKTTDDLKKAELPKTWSLVAKAEKKYPHLPIFQLLKSVSGAKSYSEAAYILINGRAFCKTCGAGTAFYGWEKGYATYCSKSCASLDKELQAKIKQNRESTMLERYGAKTTLESALLTKKVKNTNISRYGTEVAANNSSVRKKISKTVQEKYGGKSPNVCARVREKQKLAQLSAANKRRIEEARRLGYTFIDGDPRLNARWECHRGHIFDYNWQTKQTAPICRVCTPYIKGTSSLEIEVAEFVESLLPAQRNFRLYLDSKTYREADVFVPSENVAIEYNGLFWHSELAGKGRDYHLNKMLTFGEHGIHLLQFFEHEWVNKKDICKSIIRHKLKLNERIGARKLIVKDVPRVEAMDFFNQTHINGAAPFSVALGLYLDNELICCSAWGPGRFRDYAAIELIRFSCKLNIAVTGGLSRLTAAASKRFSGKTLKSFCDRRFGDGSGYLAAGWVLTRQTSPGYWYFDKSQVYHRLQFQKRKLVQLLQKNGTEWELAQLYGLNRFWDCGNLVFEKSTK